ncbi:MAG: flagellar protein FlgN [Peptostreptococcaceae bacterium]|nr:flagellar protein FlgN [Peptostreptococcaceae bacterium]
MNHYQSILNTLNKQLQLNEELLIFSREKLEVLRDNDTAALVSISGEEEKILRQIIELEKERGASIERLKNQGRDVSDIHGLIRQADEETAAALKETAERLKSVLQELKLQNELNQTVMNLTLEQMEIIKNFILSDETPSNYGKYAKEQGKTDKRFFEGKA